MSVLLHREPISTRFFTYRDRSFSADASDLNGILCLNQIYPNSCDTGFWLQSHKTGNLIPFVKTNSVKSASGEFLHDEYSVAQGSGIPDHLRDLKVYIFND